ncbi:MAG: hypothetical protein QOE92_537 [Chloroflexota bacterium]|jgi:diguanylate cyclase (GGDEF)-like protein/PAS domain S-box-containing protein|nr:hypothetical protein [Chloroflexota bacterium]
MNPALIDPAQVAAFAANAAFAVLGSYSLASWLRNRETPRLYLAGTFGLLGVVAIVSAVDEVTGYRFPLAEPLRIVAFLGSGLSLLGLRRHLLRMDDRLFLAAVALAAAVTALGILAGIPSQLDPQLNTQQVVATWLIVGTWALFVGEPAVRFWRESARSPAVQRARLRALAIGSAGIPVLLVLALTALPSRGWGGAAVLVAALMVAPILYIALSPPRWLVDRWRFVAERSMQESVVDLVSVGDDREALGRHALEWATRLLGADQGVVVGPDGEVLARIGLEDTESMELARATAATEQARVLRLGAPARQVAVVPARFKSDRVAIAVVTGPFTPVFGEHEMDQLQRYAALVGAALERVAIVEASNQAADLQASLLTGLSDIGEGLVITHAGRLVYANDAYIAMTGYSRDELDELPSLIELAPEEQREDLVARMRERLAGGDVPFQYESQLVTKDGHVVDVETVVRQLPRQGPGRIMGIVRDITMRKRVERSLRESEEKMRAVALTDAVTGLPNRRAWDAELTRAVARAHRAGESICVGVIDLDSFKTYNDDWGHQAGDLLLRAVADTWRQGLREVDFLARYGGDEFAVILPSCDAAAAKTVLERILVHTPERQTCSIGLACGSGRVTGPDLVAEADAALYQAKRDRKGMLVTAGAKEGHTDVTQHWADVIPALMAEHGVWSVYQPIVRLSDRALFGYEALARMPGSLPGDSVEELFAVAGRLGFARDLDWLGRRAAFEGAGGIPPGVPVFVNVGAGALLDPVHGVDQMVMLARWVERRPQDFVLEISERDLIRDVARMAEVLAAYRREGFRFAVDDVGEGFSTLEVLGAASPEFIKLGRSMLNRTASVVAVVRAILTFAEATNAHVIAEGLETEESVEVSRKLGVVYGQGFVLGRPGPVERGRPAIHPEAARPGLT